ncbi:MAG TPA: prepilin-type N-terminal cleavage/methylation domain-containing protein [Patescibacteria group bacterium]|nr:prepilin-type N-terminal cleavage/methylation domain-containing protein [Patescibacteria group bacterium]
MTIRRLLHRLRPPKDQRGVTLIELLVTMGLLSIMLVILTTIFTASVDVQSETSDYAAVTADGRFALSRLEYDIHRASAVTTPATLGASGSSLVLTVGSSTYTYSVSGNRLQLDIDGSSDYLTGDQSVVSGLNFQALGNPGGLESVSYSFTLTSNKAHQVSTEQFNSTTELRP